MSHSTSSTSNIAAHPEIEALWQGANPDLEAMGAVVESHFNSSCLARVQIGAGGYARVFMYTLSNGTRFAAKICLPIGETSKTEAEVATMDSIRARTSIPVPKVYLFCSSRNNPVRAEWIVMDYLAGTLWVECFSSLTWEQKKTAGTDLARAMASTFSITATHCGSIMVDSSLRDDQRAVRYSNTDPAPHAVFRTVRSHGPTGDLVVGPVNDTVFHDREDPVPASACGPFATEREYLEAMAYRGLPGKRPLEKLERWPYEKVLEVYDFVRRLYCRLDEEDTKATLAPVFHFAHNDLSSHNILLDPTTGHITGIIDWEMSGFRPGWMAAAAGADFDDDERRFLMADYQDGPDGFDDEPVEAVITRQHFRDELQKLNPRLFVNYWQGVELRAFCYNLSEPYRGNVINWLRKYEEYQWHHRRGPFPFNFSVWMGELIALRKRNPNATSSKATSALRATRDHGGIAVENATPGPCKS